MSILKLASGSRFNTGWRVVVIMVLGFSLSACGHNMSDLKQWVARQMSLPGGRVPPIPQVLPYETYTYPGHTRSPFDAGTLRRLYDKTHRGSAEYNPNRPRQFLEQFPLESLKMVGTLVDRGTTYALIQIPSGLIQRVTIGNYMGHHSGKITAITPNSIKLREVVPDGFGGFKNQSATVAMK